MPVLVVPDDAGARLLPLDAPGAGERSVPSLPAALAADPKTRWVWADTPTAYPPVLAEGTRVARCHDLALTETLLLGHEGRWGTPHSVAAAWARLHGLPVPDDEPRPETEETPTLFGPAPARLPSGADPLRVAAEVYADQQQRIAATEHPARFELLVAAESAGALAAVELTATGLPWRADVHSATLSRLLGPRTRLGVRPQRLAELAGGIEEAFGRRVNPDSPADVLAAFSATGRTVDSTRSWVLRRVDHPAVPLLLEYKKLARILAANGWAWQERWVRDGRFRPEYVPGGVVSGRWATRGGGGLQLPKVLRGAVCADPGRVLVVADAGQLEPRLLAALARDEAMIVAAQADDLYAAIASRSFAGDRARAKVGLLGAMYGQVGGQAAAPLAVLRERYPAALQVLEEAARVGERGGLVRSHLGRTCPPVVADWSPSPGTARSRGRFTRNFVVQATAAEWALVWLALVRAGLAGVDGAELVSFVHDELVVHTPLGAQAQIEELVRRCADRAGRLLFGSSGVRFPLDVAAVGCYADAG